MTLTIDNLPCDLDPTRKIALDYDAARLADIGRAREGRSLTLTLPATPRNDARMSFARDPHAAERFNASLHRAELRAEGALLLGGSIRLLRCDRDGYTVEIRDGGARWASAAARSPLGALPVEFRTQLTPTAICAGWSDQSPVKFFPVRRDAYPQRNAPNDLLPAERLLGVEDYHPFLHVATMVEALFAASGYRIRSRFMASEPFRSLYMSGAYASRDTTAARNRMGFLARRRTTVSATADDFGRIYANPKAAYNTVGNLVETATPQTPDEEGVPIPEIYNNGGCFALDNGKIAYTPLTEVSVSFEYYLRYTTDHRILTRDRLAGFDSVYLGPGSQMDFTLANRYPDRRNELAPDRSYRAVVFEHAPGAQYRLTCTLHGVAGSVWAEFSARSALVATPAAGNPQNPVLQVKRSGAWTEYAGDWALYDGYIAETGRTTVELRVTSAPEVLTPASPRTFNTLYFYGAEPGMTLTLHPQCSLGVRFSSHPGFGATVTFADAAHHGVRQSVLLEALCQMFNLRLWTDEETSMVVIEPADDFFGAGPEADWRERTDFAQPVLLEEGAPAVHERRTWRYAEPEGAAARLDADSDRPFGAWSYDAPTFGTLEGEEVSRNPLFHPTVNSAGHYLNAPSALLPEVGERDDAASDGTGFRTRIVRYCGLHPLPPGERWGYPSGRAEYPLAAFHFAGDDAEAPFTLCFEDRNGATGLHRYYDRQVAREATRQRITLSLRLEPHEFEALFTPGTGAPDLRSVFRLDTGAGEVRAVLHRIEAYDPETASARCTFTRLAED